MTPSQPTSPAYITPRIRPAAQAFGRLCTKYVDTLNRDKDALAHVRSARITFWARGEDFCAHMAGERPVLVIDTDFDETIVLAALDDPRTAPRDSFWEMVIFDGKRRRTLAHETGSGDKILASATEGMKKGSKELDTPGSIKLKDTYRDQVLTPEVQRHVSCYSFMRKTDSDGKDRDPDDRTLRLVGMAGAEIVVHYDGSDLWAYSARHFVKVPVRNYYRLITSTASDLSREQLVDDILRIFSESEREMAEDTPQPEA